MINEDKKYDNLINTLKGLQQVKAPPNFEAGLKRRLNKEKYAREEKSSIKNFLVPSRLIPSFGLAVAAIIVFLLIDLNSEEADNPFMIEPKVREDIFMVSDQDEIELPEGEQSGVRDKVEEKVSKDKMDTELRHERMAEEESPDENLVAETEVAPPESTITSETEVTPTDEISAPVATGFAIRKSGLNFRQIKPTKKEQEQILELKQKVQTEINKEDIK